LTEELVAKHEKLERTMHDDVAKLMIQILSQLSGVKMHKPSKNFASEKPDSNGNPGKAVTCAIKSNAGHLFMCEKFFVFLIRPAVIVKFDDIRSVQFSRAGKVGGGSSSFDLEIDMKKSETRHEFSNIPRAEYNGLFIPHR